MLPLSALHRPLWAKIRGQAFVHARQARVTWRCRGRQCRGESSEELFEVEAIERGRGRCRDDIVIPQLSDLSGQRILTKACSTLT